VPVQGDPAGMLKFQRSRGVLDLRFSLSGQATVLSSAFQSAPCRVMTPVPDPKEPFTAVLLTTSGGLTGGDQVTVSVNVAPNATALCTPQAAERIYRAADEQDAHVSVTMTLGSEATLEWLPQETILFDRARLRRGIEIGLTDTSRLLAGDIVVFGRLASGERFRTGFLFDRWQVRRGGRLIWRDVTRLDGDVAEPLAHPAGYNGGVAQALILCQTPNPEPLRDMLRGLIADDATMLAGVTILEGLLLVRLLDSDPARLRRRFACLWSALRPAINRPVAMPRHWKF
jgi:urease accessory protein